MAKRVIVLLLSAHILCTHAALSLPSIDQFFRDLLHGNAEPDISAEQSRVKRQSPGIGDDSQLAHESRTSSLPLSPDGTLNTRYMPTLGNGHIAVTVYNETLHLNGLYNGVGALSHRAKIPAVIMSRVILDDDQESLSTRRFIFNVEDGVFTETIDAPFAFIEHRTYVHQRYIRTYVSDIYAKRKTAAPGGGIIRLSYPDIDETDDIDFGERRRHHANWRISGTTRESEEGVSAETVHVFWHERVSEIPLRGSLQEVNETIIMSVDRQESLAMSDFDNAVSVTESGVNGHYNLLRQHIEAWQEIWSRGRIDVEGDVTLSKVTRFSQYYLLSSLPPLMAQQPPQHSDYFYGMGRTSLAKGSDHRDFQGHILWDSEMYILPAVLLFHPDLAKKMMRYRAEKAQAAQSNAEGMGSVGYKFPWASARSGTEVSQELDVCGASCLLKRYHNTGAVAWAMRQYYSATRDRDYVINPDFDSCDMTREIARFFADRAVYNPSKGRYDINDITGPDLNHPDVDNNAYTLVVASLAIHWARYYACICNRHASNEVPDEWIQKAMYLNLPYDNVKRMHDQFEGFDETVHRPIRQADTILLTYPLNWNMSRDIMRNDLQLYEQVTDDRTPAMTWSFFTVGWKWVNDINRMETTFRRSYQDYLISPFYVWTQYNERHISDQEVGSVNYLPGMGGFLQSLIYGFAGIRIRPKYLEFHDPQPPPGTTRLRFVDFNYLGASLLIVIEANRVDITVNSIDEFELELRMNDTWGEVRNLVPGAFVRIDTPQNGFYIHAIQGEACEHPRDYIYMPWGYSPWISGSTRLEQTSYTVALVFICVLLFFNYDMAH